jgi:predicted transcriptional regulator
MSAKKTDNYLGFHYFDIKPTAEQIRDLRKQTGLSRAAFGAMLRASFPSVAGWERGTQKMPAITWYLIQRVGVDALLADYMSECDKVRAVLDNSA